MAMEIVLSKDPVNTGRQFELDIARGLAVFFMIAIHTVLIYSNSHVQTSLVGATVDFFGSPTAAPVFLFLLGIGIVYSRRSEPGRLMKRGLILFCMGYLLNVSRLGAPEFLCYLNTGNRNFLVESVFETLSIDLFQFAGLTFTFFGILKRFRAGVVSLAVTGLVLVVMNIFVVKVQYDNIWLSAVTGLFWGSSKISYFPFLTWIAYPIAGYIFGAYLIRAADKLSFYKITFLASAVLLVFFSLFFTLIFKINIRWNELGLETDFYYHHTLFSNIIFVLFSVLWISSLYLATKLPGIPAILRTTIERWSRNVSEIYFIQWILLYWTAVLIMGVDSNSHNTFDLLPSFIMFIIFIVSSDALAGLYIYLKENKLSSDSLTT